MATRNWREAAELIGIIAIVGSLLFVGYQLRQDRLIAQAQMSLDYEIKQTEVSGLIAEHSDVWARGLANEQLDPADEAVFDTLVHALSVKYDATFDRAQTQLGTRSDTSGIARQFAMHIYSHPGLRRAWAKRCDYLKQVSGDDIPPCARVRAALKRIDDGLDPKPVGALFSP